MSLSGKVIVLTGATQGIGEATAAALAGVGANLVLASRSVESLQNLAGRLSSQGSAAVAVPTDVRDASSVAHLFRTVDEQFGGRLDVLINSAGVCYLAALIELDMGDFDEMLATNVRGTLLCIREAVPRLRANGGGHIVNLSSAVARHVPATVGGYGASKCAVEGLSQALAQETYGDGIRVHTVEPTLVDTPMRRRLFPERDRTPWIDAANVARAIVFALDQDPKVMIDCVRVLPYETYYAR